MSVLSIPISAPRLRHWLPAVALAGAAWNLFGAVQFARLLTATAESLVASGLTPAQAAVMTGLPMWMTLVFALGVGGGLVGSMLLLGRHGAAPSVMAGTAGSGPTRPMR